VAGYQSKRDDKKAAKQSWSGKVCSVGSTTIPNRSKDAVDVIRYDLTKSDDASVAQ